MKKPSSTPEVQDYIGTKVYRAARKTAPLASEFYAAPPRKRHRRISYVPGETPPDKATVPPSLFIRGLLGGSLNLDLRGLNIELSEGAFAHWVADESLSQLHIHRGDIAIVDCAHRISREGNLVLLEEGGREVLRRLRRRHQIWHLETADGSKQDLVPLTTQPLQGTVVGILRLFTKVKPSRYDRGSINLAVPAEAQCRDLCLTRSRRGPEAKAGHRSSAKQSAVALAAEQAAAYPRKARDKKPS